MTIGGNAYVIAEIPPLLLLRSLNTRQKNHAGVCAENPRLI
ncbi:hypothetical protein QOZ95_004560 [Paenibacillus brasilensis]|uniref:Uncharacterized protein n=1 Tax=Paenibacillus brasilensis TaxID=128574 RepID=A0ABU0L553_9BACL|nr:hypothetical protein [Paenibacillus brasilensis]